jgi:acyl carrier protein
VNATIRKLLAETGRLSLDVSTLSDDQDLYAAGLSSFSTVQLMLAIEDSFDIEFPERMLNRRTFATIAALEAAVGAIVAQRHAA